MGRALHDLIRLLPPIIALVVPAIRVIPAGCLGSITPSGRLALRAGSVGAALGRCFFGAVLELQVKRNAALISEASDGKTQ